MACGIIVPPPGKEPVSPAVETRIDAEAEVPDVKNWIIGKDPDAGKDWGQKEKGATEDEMVGRHRKLNGHEFEQTRGDGEGWGNLECCCPWGHKKSDRHQRLNNNKYSVYTDLDESFHNEWTWNFVKCFFCIEMMVWFLSFLLLMWCVVFLDLCILKHHYTLKINLIWSQYMTLFIYYWILFTNILLRIFASMFIRDICMHFFFLVSLALASGYWWSHRMNLGVFFPLQVFWRVWEGQALALPYMFGRIAVWCPGLLFAGTF